MISSGLVPVFGLIEDIIMDDNHSFFFLTEVFNTLRFSPHFHAYEVITQTPKAYQICKPSTLYDHAVLGRYQVVTHSSFYIPLKYHLVEKI